MSAIKTTLAPADAADQRAARQILVSIVAPFFNESAMTCLFHRTISDVLQQIAHIDYELICVNDGSRDDTLALLSALAHDDPHMRVIDLSRNFGKEAALTAGLDHAAGDVVIPIDVDLQDPPELIEQMIDKWRAGYDVVLARRANRDTDTLLKRTAAGLFYKLHNKAADVGIPENVGDFRLMDRKVLEALHRLPERRRFMKGLFHWVGFPSVTIDFIRQPRKEGKTKFSGWRLWNFALEGITSFSTLPLRIWTYVGLIVAFVAFIYAVIIIALTLIRGTDTPGYASLMTVMLMLGGIQLIGIGVIGEYIGRIYAETKQRPIYIVRDIIEQTRRGG